MENIKEITKHFKIKGKLLEIKSFSSGHINSTSLITFLENDIIKKYVLQKINKNVFKNPENVMDNIINVTKFIKNKLGNNKFKNHVLNFLQAENEKYFFVDLNGDYWRVYEFIDNSITFDSTNDSKILQEAGRAFGKFQHYLSDFLIKDLFITIPHFHNTINRYKMFYDKIKENPKNRKAEVTKEIEEYLKLEEIATKMYKMQKAGELQLRVTHNDTKCNNVLFDKDTFSHLCVIDLDTVMPGLIGFDFGDAIRFNANTSSEDEKNLDKVKIDLDKFKAFSEGFLKEALNSLTINEKNTLVLGAITMTVECGVRFLTDYLDGDNYFKIDYEKQNLDRARCQLKLAQDMIKNYDKMNDIINQLCNKNLTEIL